MEKSNKVEKMLSEVQLARADIQISKLLGDQAREILHIRDRITVLEQFVSKMLEANRNRGKCDSRSSNASSCSTSVSKNGKKAGRKFSILDRAVEVGFQLQCFSLGRK